MSDINTPLVALRVYTLSGERAHYMLPDAHPLPGVRRQTRCYRAAYALHDIPFERHHKLAQAPVCARCERAEEAEQHAGKAS